jgi:hypothetical protein
MITELPKITIRIDENGFCKYQRRGERCDLFGYDGEGNEWCEKGWEIPNQASRLHPGQNCPPPGEYILIEKHEYEQMMSR